MVCASALIFAGAAHPVFAHESVDRVLRAEQSHFDERVGLAGVPQEYRAKGVVFRGFVMKPSIEMRSLYNDNLYAQGHDAKSDVALVFRPSLRVRKSAGALDMALHLRGNSERYRIHSGENKDEIFASFGAEYQPNTRWRFPFHMNYSARYQDRGAPDQMGSLLKPTRVTEFSTATGVERRFNRLSLRLMGKYNDISFEDGVLQADPGAVIVKSDEDRKSYGGNMRLSYLIPRNDSGNSGHSLFFDLDVQRQLYERASHFRTGRDPQRKDNVSYSAIAGVATSYKGLIEASIGAGIMSRIYDADALGTVDGLDIAANVKYLVNPKLVLEFEADRAFSQYYDTGRGVIETQASLAADYEIYHNLYWRNALAYKYYDYADGDRKDRDWVVGTHLKYHLNDRFYTQLGLTHQRRDSNVAGRDFDRNMILLSVTSQF